MKETDLVEVDCPCCQYAWSKYIALHTDWGYENFFQCENCGVIFNAKKYSKSPLTNMKVR